MDQRTELIKDLPAYEKYTFSIDRCHPCFWSDRMEKHPLLPLRKAKRCRKNSNIFRMDMKVHPNIPAVESKYSTFAENTTEHSALPIRNRTGTCFS